MGYSNFKKIEQVTKKFGLDALYAELFTAPSPPPYQPTDWLIESLRRAKFSPPTNEKSKAERIVSPILLEVLEKYMHQITFFSGETLDVDSTQDLAGECDFFFSLHPPKPYIQAPIISITESKDEDMEWGIAQCAAQLYGAKLFNDKESKKVPCLYGCATDGVEWQFLRFEKNIFYIDNKIYTDLKEILGVWHHIIQFYIK
jgi:hypothetical protein